MRRLFKFLLAGLLYASSAGAVGLHVDDFGSGTDCTIGAPCALGRADSVVAAGDTVYLANGIYSRAPKPALWQRGTASAAIVYIGNSASPDSVRITPHLDNILGQSGQVGNWPQYTHWKYIRFNGDVRISPREKSGSDTNIAGIRFQRCVFRRLFKMSGASWSKMDSCSMPENRDGGHSQFWPMSYYGAQFNKGADGSYGTCQRDTFTNNTFVLTTADTFWYGVDRPTTDPNGAYWMIRVDALDNALFKNNKITVKYLAKTLYRTAARAAYFSQSERDSFIDNKWTFTDSTTLSDRDSQDFSNSWRIREKWRFMKYLRDTLIVNGVTGADNAAVLFASSGGEGPAYTSGMHQRNRWHQCYFRWEHNSGTDDDYGLFGFESAPSVYPTAASGLYNDTLSYCIIATNTASKNGNGGIWFADVMGANLIDHCTFFGTSSAASLLEQINWGNKGRWGTGATLRITNNIFYAPATTGSSTGMTINQFQSAANRTSLYSDNNLFAVYRGTGKDIKFKTNCTQYGGGCTATLESGVPSGQWFTQTGNDGLSVHGSPKFTDSTFATFDPTPGAGSAAINLGENGTTAGAIQVLVDATAPAAIADLHALSMSSSGTEIRWTAPGDSVNTGTAQAYYIKYATTAITNDATYNSAALGAVLACQVAGSTETFVLNLPSHSTTYWIAIKTVDEAGNYSALSNIISVRTASQDPNDVSTEWL